MNFHRQRGRRRRIEETLKEKPIDAGGPFDHDPLSWLMHGEQRIHVRGALSQLPPEDNEILLLKYTENWTYQQLAQHLGVSHNTIEYRLIRAKKKLRRLLGAIVGMHPITTRFEESGLEKTQ